MQFITRKVILNRLSYIEFQKKSKGELQTSQLCQNVMKFGMVKKLTTVNIFVLHASHRNITHLAVMTSKTNMKIDILKGGGGGVGKEPKKEQLKMRGEEAKSRQLCDSYKLNRFSIVFHPGTRCSRFMLQISRPKVGMFRPSRPNFGLFPFFFGQISVFRF